MAISKYTIYKYVKVDDTWRYCKAAYHENGKIKPDIVFVNVRQALLEKHPEGRYYLSHNGQWLDAGTDALARGAAEAQAAAGARRIQPAQRKGLRAKVGRSAGQLGQDHAGGSCRKIFC